VGVLENVRKTGTPIRVTRFGKPIADIVPPAIAPQKSRLGPIGAFKRWKV
jgi:antitoxin (DNA-binding transcriptional repressor) of toxin-antitoxin stability system